MNTLIDSLFPPTSTPHSCLHSGWLIELKLAGPHLFITPKLIALTSKEPLLLVIRFQDGIRKIQYYPSYVHSGCLIHPKLAGLGHKTRSTWDNGAPLDPDMVQKILEQESAPWVSNSKW